MALTSLQWLLAALVAFAIFGLLFWWFRGGTPLEIPPSVETLVAIEPLWDISTSDPEITATRAEVVYNPGPPASIMIYMDDVAYGPFVEMADGTFAYTPSSGASGGRVSRADDTKVKINRKTKEIEMTRGGKSVLKMKPAVLTDKEKRIRNAQYWRVISGPEPGILPMDAQVTIGLSGPGVKLLYLNRIYNFKDAKDGTYKNQSGKMDMTISDNAVTISHQDGTFNLIPDDTTIINGPFYFCNLESNTCAVSKSRTPYTNSTDCGCSHPMPV